MASHLRNVLLGVDRLVEELLHLVGSAEPIVALLRHVRGRDLGEGDGGGPLLLRVLEITADEPQLVVHRQVFHHVLQGHLLCQVHVKQQFTLVEVGDAAATILQLIVHAVDVQRVLLRGGVLVVGSRDEVDVLAPALHVLLEDQLLLRQRLHERDLLEIHLPQTKCRG